MSRYFGLDEANRRLADLRPLLVDLRADRDALAEVQREVLRLQAQNGSSEHEARLRERQQAVAQLVRRMKKAVAQMEEWNVTLRDIGTGLIDFPALVNGRPVWLCWRLDEGPIAWWHELNTGFGARRPLEDLI
jgi:hypothetical protein